MVYSADEKTKEIEWLNKIIQDERDLAFSATILEVAIYEDDMLYWPEYYFEDGMVLKVVYEKVPAAEGKSPNHAVGIRLSVGMEESKELEGKFKFARQKSKLAGKVRGSFFILKMKGCKIP